MKRIENIKSKLLITIVYLAILGLFYYFSISCFFESLFGIPCPGCGMTRAVRAAFALDFPAAFQFHAMFWSIPVLYLYFIFDGNLFKNRTINKAVFIGIAVGFLAVWILKLYNI